MPIPTPLALSPSPSTYGTLSKHLCLPRPILLILQLPPILLFRLIPTRHLNTTSKRLSPRIQLPPCLLLSFPQLPHRDGLVAAEPLAHVDHPALALTETLLKLLAFRW